MAINVVLANDDLTVLGPPASIDLQVDVGPQGDRGSYVYSGFNDPNIVSSPFVNKAPEIGDLFFRTSNNSVYQYVAIPGGEQWELISVIEPVSYTSIENITFSAGSGSVSILLNEIYENAPLNLTSDDIGVNAIVEKSNPVAISISGKTLTSGATRSLLIDFVAAEYSTGSWASLSGSANVNVNINLVA